MLVFDRWKDHELIMERFRPIVYPRPGYPCSEAIDGLPEFAVSSTEIRQMIGEGREVNSLLPPGVTEYIKDNNLYS